MSDALQGFRDEYRMVREQANRVSAELEARIETGKVGPAYEEANRTLLNCLLYWQARERGVLADLTHALAR